MKLFITFCLAWLSACSGQPDGISVIDGFELERYLGTWYEIARLDHRFERGLEAVTAEYSLNDDGSVKVINSGFDPERQQRVSAEGKALFVSTPDVGRLKVSFFWPIFGGYNIIALDKDHYQYAMVAGPDLDYLWIMSRQPQLDSGILQRLVEQADNLGFATESLILVSHSE